MFNKDDILSLFKDDKKKNIILLFIEEISILKDEKKLFEFKNIFFKNHVNPLLMELKNIPIDQKKNHGIDINNLKIELNKIFDYFQEKFSLKQSFDASFPPLISSNGMEDGGINLIDRTIYDIIKFFNKLGFDLINGDELVSVEDNFSILNIDENHPAREDHDSFYISKKHLLRSHCTAATAKFIKVDKREEIKIISIGNVYRKDEDDATHSHQFNQLDLVWLRKDLSIKNLKWIVNEFLSSIFNIKNLKTRYRPSHFPFTEPSFEVDIACFKCNSLGCNICKQSGWIEILGAGIFHPNVLLAINVEEKNIGLAFGLGIDRIVMIKYGIKDIRYLYNNDFRVLKQFKGNF